MFQLGSLLVLCGLLTGTSASVSGLPQNLNTVVESLQKTTALSSAKDTILGALNALDLSQLGLFSSNNGLGLQINELEVLDLQVSIAEDNNIIVKLPVKVNASLSLPIGSTVNIAVSLDLITSLTVQNDAQTGLPTLTLQECSNDAQSISVSLLGRQIPFVNSILDTISSALTRLVSGLLQNQICPLLQGLLENLNANLVLSLLSTLQAAVPL